MSAFGNEGQHVQEKNSRIAVLEKQKATYLTNNNNKLS